LASLTALTSFASLIWWAALVVAVFAAYRPVWNGGLLWDDEAHVIPETLRSIGGLGRLWLDPSASQQYYPVASTVFWFIGRFFTGTFAYHAANILLHASSAFLVTVILRRLAIPGAVVAGAIFALHPVNVESVAWISELKNTLSGFCYLAAFLAYIRFDQTRTKRAYALAFAFFLLALGSKTVTASLPAALLVVFWWKRGTLELRTDVLPLVPFFAAGVAAGLGTAWIEYHVIGAQGARFEFNAVERVLLAGRVVWFYAATIAWPVNLMFSYPRWTIDSGAWWQWLFPIGLIGVLVFLFAIRQRSRAPLASALFFAGTLFPVLGFLNVYPFRFSFVADHFQYLAALGVVTGLSAGIMIVLARWRVSEIVAATVIAAPLGILTASYSGYFSDAQTLYRETIERNPGSLLAHGNLASLLLEGPPSGWVEAMAHARTTLSIDPESVAGHNLLGTALQRAGRPEEALPELRRAVSLDPGLAEAHYNLGLTLASLGRPQEAIDAYRRSLEIYPQNVKALHNLANVLREEKRYADALGVLRKAIDIDPDSADVRLNLADTLQASGDLPGAIAAYQIAIGRRPDWGEAWNNLGLALKRSGRAGEARQAFETAVRLLPDAPLVHINLASIYADAGEFDRAIHEYERAIALASPQQAAGLRQQLETVRKLKGR